ncbi:MAG: hypothetical protein WCO29_19330 [Nostocales cyanobacterium ELA583]
MLLPAASERFQSAQKVLEALSSPLPTVIPTAATNTTITSKTTSSTTSF